MSSPTDPQLEADFLKDPEASFRAVFDRYSGPLLRFVYRFTASSEASEEILQDVFLELLRGRFSASTEGTLKSWLFTVAKNKGLNYRKKAKRSVSLVTTEQEQELVAETDIESETIFRNLLIHLETAEQSLPHEIQETWKLRRSGLDNQQIAEALSIPLGTVKSRFSRLVHYLRKDFL